MTRRILFALLVPVALAAGYRAGLEQGRAAVQDEADIAAQWVCTLSTNAAEIAECAASRARLAARER